MAPQPPMFIQYVGHHSWAPRRPNQRKSEEVLFSYKYPFKYQLLLAGADLLSNNELGMDGSTFGQYELYGRTKAREGWLS